jgi:hypothetical protein
MMSDGILAFIGSDPVTPKALGTYRFDLSTGVLAELGDVRSDPRAPVVAGHFVIWHDSNSFHVGEFAQ